MRRRECISKMPGRQWFGAMFALLAFACSDGASPPTEQDTQPQQGDTSEGRWVEASSSADVEAAAERGLIDQLVAIGYLQGSRDTRDRGVTIHDPTRAHAGLNLYSSGHAPEAILMDMNGKLVHRWHFPYEQAYGLLDKPNSNTQWWRRVAIFENGDLLAIYEGLGLIKIDKDSNLIWSSPLHAHHDLEVQPNGDIYVLTRKAHRVPRIDPEAPVLEDFVSILSEHGKLRAEMSLLEAFEGSRFASLVRKDQISGNGDLFHTNSITVLDSRFDKKNRIFGEGNILTSMNRMGVVAVINIRLGQVVWVRQTQPIGQHDPQLLGNGNMLLFTNNMNARNDGTGDSRIEEFNPVSKALVWTYRGTEAQPFYSKYLGTAERLPNGNTLITESDAGRAFEVLPSGEIVWQFYNPNRAGDAAEFIATLPEVIRLPADFPTDWLRRESTAPN